MESTVKSKHNLLLAFTKIMFSIWIWYRHSFFIIENKNYHQSTTFLFVSFFFICSGYYIYNSIAYFIQKHRDEKKIISIYIWNRLKKMGVPLLICYLVSFANTFVTKEYNTGFMHLLWYIHVMIIFELISFIILLKAKKKTYTIINIIVLLITTAIYYTVGESNIPSEIRCFMFMPLGYLLSLIKLPEKKSYWYLIPYLIFLCLASYIASKKIELKYDILAQFIVFPALFMSSLMVPLYNDGFAYFFASKLSFLIYISQSITRLYDSVKPNLRMNCFYITLSCTTVFMIYEIILYFTKKKGKDKLITNKTI